MQQAIQEPGGFQAIPTAQLNTFVDERKRMMFPVVLATRPGVRVWSTYVEYTLYPPGTEDNDSFEMIMVKWEGENFIMFGLPLRDRRKIENIAEVCGLRLIQGTPTMIGGGKGSEPRHWPVRGRQMFTLENSTDAGLRRHWMRHGIRTVLSHEGVLSERILRGWKPSLSHLKSELLHLPRTGATPGYPGTPPRPSPRPQAR